MEDPRRECGQEAMLNHRQAVRGVPSADPLRVGRGGRSRQISPGPGRPDHVPRIPTEFAQDSLSSVITITGRQQAVAEGDPRRPRVAAVGNRDPQESRRLARPDNACPARGFRIVFGLSPTEHEGTAMISSKVIAPEMPEPF